MGSADAPPTPDPNTLRNQLYSVPGPGLHGGWWSKYAKTSTKNRFMYFVESGNHVPLLALGTDPRSFVKLDVGSSGTSVQRLSESPAWCTWLEPALQNEGK